MFFRKLRSLFSKKSHQAGRQHTAEEEVPIVPVDTEPETVSTIPIIVTNSNKTIMATQAHIPTKANADMPIEFLYLEALILHRLGKYFPGPGDVDTPPDLPGFDDWDLPLVDFVIENNLSNDEAVLLLIAITPHIEPDLFNRILESKMPDPRETYVDFPQIGGVRGKNSRFFLPTAQTALFLIGGESLSKRLQVQQLFGAEHIFWERKILWLEDMQNGEPAMHGRLIMSPDYIDLFTYGIHNSPQFSISFPAKKIAPLKKGNPPTFKDLVIPEELKEQIDELKDWLEYNDELMNRYGMKDKLKKGYRTMFYGPPGTGKTFTAQILGNELKKDVFKIDLSMVVSKYIGETEKNLELLFARAEDKGWILFFDEADALFGKRTNVRDAHDKYANQEVSYLLQRIEDYNGLVILATNMKNNIDEAFLRRFNSILKFPFPDQFQRAQIWEKVLPKDALFRKKTIAGIPAEVKEEKADIPELVKKYELTGGNIINVVHYASIKSVGANQKNKELQQKEAAYVAASGSIDSPHTASETKKQDGGIPKLTIYLSDVLEGIKKELIKEGKPFAV